MSGWDEIGDGVWTRHYASLSLRAGVVAGDGGVLVVDTRSHYGEADELLGHIAELGAGPVRWVVNTHYHWDHTFGNGRFSPAPIWGHVNCASGLERYGESMREGAARYMAGAVAEIAAVEIVPPEHTFADTATLDLGSRQVGLHYFGRGHTDSDIAVVVADAAVLFAGDLVEEGAPPAFDDAYPLDWAAALDGMLELVEGPVVPGHGDVVDRAFVVDQRDAIAASAEMAMNRHRAGTPPEVLAPAGSPFPAAVMASIFQRAHLQLSGAL